MRLRQNPGLAISAGAHAALLLAVLVGFSQSSRVDDLHETIPVELVEVSELDQITKGDKTAPAPKPRPQVLKQADVADPKPTVPNAVADKDVTPPPPMAKREPDPGREASREEPKPALEEAKPARKSAAVEPPRPEPKPRKVEQAKAETPEVPAKPVPREDAEPLAPKPVPKPKVAKPEPEPQPKPEPPKEAKRQAPPKKPEPRVEPDRIAALLDAEKQKEPARKPTEKPAAKPRSGDAAAQKDSKFDPTDISKFLSQDAPQRKAAAGAELQQVAALGAPTASAARMSPSLWSQLDGLLQEQYKRCWTFIGLGGQSKYVPEIRVHYAEDGSLTEAPQLVNPPADPALKALADSALRAVRRCNPLQIPARYQAYYEQWKGRIVRFDPEDML